MHQPRALTASRVSFLDATTHIYKRSCLSVLFSNDENGRFEGKKSSNEIINNDTTGDDEKVASDVPPRYLFRLRVEGWIKLCHCQVLEKKSVSRFLAGTAGRR